MFASFGDKRKVIFIKTISEVPTVIGRRKIKATTKSVMFKKKPYPIDTKTPTYRNKNKFMYMYDLDKGQQSFNPLTCIQSDETYDLVFKKEIAKQLISGLEKKGLSSTLIELLLAIGMALSVGYILGNVIPMSGV